LEDHSRIEDLFNALIEAVAADAYAQAATLWVECERGLSWHLDTEDELLLPRLLSDRPRDARAILAEHRHLRLRLAEFGGGLSRPKLESARAFVAELRAHTRHEEKVLYHWVDERLPSDELDAILEVVRLRSGAKPPDRSA
jgi:hemerythrin-like domain-containing protein